MATEAVRDDAGEPETTWDGLPIAADLPRGSAVVVRRPAAGGWEYLLLHRAHQGPAYEGDWAWTPPSGARQPGEPLLGSALRELAEEAGLTDVQPAAVDLSGGWALYLVEVSDAAVVLVDPEHDRYLWAGAEEAVRRCAPEVVRENIRRIAALPPLPVSFRPGPDSHELLVDGVPHGLLGHTVTPGADHAELRWTLGEPERSLPGLATRALWHYLREVLLPGAPEVCQVRLHATGRWEARAAEEAGFLPGAAPEAPHVLDVARVFGRPQA